MRIQPKKVPLFAFAWLDIVGHRLFMGRVLTHDDPICGYYYVKLILLHLTFLAPYLRNIDLPKSVSRYFWLFMLSISEKRVAFLFYWVIALYEKIMIKTEKINVAKFSLL